MIVRQAKGETLRSVYLLTLLLLCCACGSEQQSLTASKDRTVAEGRRLIRVYGCVHCHQFSEMVSTAATIGPPLGNWSNRSFIAGRLPNQPRELERWLLAPRSFKRLTAMPDLGISETEARAIAAYLYSQ